jgi:hypothetical protein
MSCPACGGDRLTFVVPPSLRPYAPDETSRAALCTTCLRVGPVDDAADPASAATTAVDWGPLPTGEAGVAMALLLGHLDSLALRRADVTELVDHVETAGGDPFATLDRLVELAATYGIDPYLDLKRRATQLQSMLD